MPRFLFFHMKGCGHCERMHPIWAKLKESYPAGKVSLEDHEISDPDTQTYMKQLHEPFRGVPHVVLLMESGQQYIFRDDRTVEALSAFLDRHLSFHGMEGGSTASWAVHLGVVSAGKKRKRRSSPRKSPPRKAARRSKRHTSPRKRRSPKRRRAA